MGVVESPNERTVRRRVFEAWSIEVPTTFAETFIKQDGYWHANDEFRSVSLTSMVINDAGQPVPAARIAGQILPTMRGQPQAEVPAGQLGRAVTVDLPQPARASRALSGVLVADGRLLLATITSDDLAWATRTWLSIRRLNVQEAPVRGRELAVRSGE